MLIILAIITDDERKSLNKLIVCVNNGDKEALGEIYRIAGGRMLSVAMGLMRNKQLAEEVLHDSFIKVARFSSQYNNGTNAYGWLCSIVRNTALNRLKSEKIKTGENIDSFFDISDKAIPEEWDKVVVIQDALKQLNPRQRTVIWLKYYNDMTVREIAEELKLPRSTAQDIISSAEKQLKKILKNSDK